MGILRVDAWTKHQDKILADTILKYIRYGKTQLQAFEDAGEVLDRSASACGFRWNSCLRNQFQEEVRLARRERRHQKVDMPKIESPAAVEVIEKKKAVSVENIEVKEFKGLRVVTFKDVDEVHGRRDGTAKRNFTQNKKHLIENEDFFLLTTNLKDEFRTLEIPNRGLTLLTESGYLMLVKSFTDDLAWGVQRNLVKNYFRTKELSEEPIYSYMIADPVERAKAWIKEQEDKQKLETKNLMLEQQVAEYEPKINYIDTILQSTDSLIVSQIAEDYGLSAMKLNFILHEEEVQYKKNGQWLLYSPHKGLGYTQSKTHSFIKPNGEQGSKIHTRWTQKGRLFIHGILSDRGITPLMDRNEQEKKSDAPTSDI
ncbi:phage antirepressor KilAC domain-containing protein [Peribacillus frigoritolerans]|uniref:phage antirepressor KilAC domain-containing protein n=1 Tax=Peribacillus frigoritolerans TaxID=450367 RepID=UPI003CFE8FE7